MTFDAMPGVVAPGGTVTLTWRAAGAAADLFTYSARGFLGEPQAVPVSGSRVMTVPADRRNEIQFELAVRDGSSAPAAVQSVTVRLTCPDGWFFAHPPGECPAAPAEQTSVVAQQFEHGQMLWVGSRGEIQVLYDDGRRDVIADQWHEGLPATDPSLAAPSGLAQPERGFGLVWRTRADLRDRLGWATSAEFPVPDGHWQCDSTYGMGMVCYVTGPDSAILALPMGTWRKWSGP
jgi:hypothetical protein